MDILNKRKYLLHLMFAACVLLGGVNSVFAQGGGQFYFTGLVAPQGSMSAMGSGTHAVYLRWDIIEGDMPSDLKEIVLLRDGLEISRSDPNQLMNAAEIDALYAGAIQERRRLEMMRWLTEADPTATGTIGERITLMASTNTFWNSLASRIDFNVARAHHRAYLDTSASAVHHYELQAVSLTNIVKRIGYLTVDATTAKTLPSGLNFHQVFKSRCDAPEASKDDGAVYINWDMPGTTVIERISNNLMIAGFDLYRTTGNVVATGSPAPRSMRALAAAASHDANGNLVLAGLEKVNDQPVLVTPDQPSNESGKLGWNPPISQFQETAAAVAARGLKPGDTRAYYLVPRDFTGNYGATVAAFISIPDLRKPVAPWHVHTILNSAAPLAADKFILEWPAVDVRNYSDDHQVNRQYCNLATARNDGELRYVAADGNCASDTQAVIKLDATKYLIYRFDDIQTARSFSDSDGDGYSDISERTVVDATRSITTPGVACNAAVNHGGVSYLASMAPNHVLASTAVTRPDGRKLLQFKDATPVPPSGSTSSTVYWYRIASVDASGNISPLSKPIRAFFPSRQFPSRTNLDTTLQVGTAASCTYFTTTKSNLLALYPFGKDLTGDADTMRVSCTIGRAGHVADIALDNLLIGGVGARLTKPVCGQFIRDCDNGAALTTSYLDAAGNVLATHVSTGQDLSPSCPQVGYRTVLEKSCIIQVPGGVSPVQPNSPGQVVDAAEWPLINYTGSQCIKVYREINGESEHFQTLCPPQVYPVKLDMPALGGGKVCISIAEMTADGEVSAKQQIPCVIMADGGSPAAPQLTGLTFDSPANQSIVNWMPPEQPVAGTIFEWYWKGADDLAGQTVHSKFIGHAGHTRQNGALQDILDLTPEQAGTNWQEEWCVRGRSVGYAKSGNEENALSQWSSELCSSRLPATATPPAYLPWPKINAANKLGDLAVTFVSDTTGLLSGYPVIQLSNPVAFPASCILNTNADINLNKLPPGSETGSCANFCSTLETSVTNGLGFVVYRQRSKTDPVLGLMNATDYSQVSPLINRMQCQITQRPTTSVAGVTTPYISTLNDPFISLLWVTSLPDWQGLYVTFVDKYPHAYHDWYRYQLVYFDTNAEITGYRATPWVKEP